MYKSLADAIMDAEAEGKSLSEIALQRESEDQGRPIAEIRASLSRARAVMRGAIGDGMTGELRSSSGLVGGDAAKLFNDAAGPLADTPLRDILARGLAVQVGDAAKGGVG